MPNGDAVHIGLGGGIWQGDGQKWTKLPGAAKDVAVGSNGKLWVIGTNREAGGYGIYRRDGARWTKIGGSAVKIAVNGAGNAWVVNKHGNIYEYDGKRWHHRPGKALDVGCYDDAVMVVGTDRRYYRYNHAQRSWARTTGASGAAIAVGKDGQALITTHRGHIWYQNN